MNNENLQIDEKERITEEIINIGHGIYESKTHNDEAFTSYKENEAAENKREWTEISRHSKNVAKFNPYMKENLKKMIAQDIYREFLYKVNLCANMYTSSSDEVQANLDNIKLETIKSFENNGLETAQYHEFAERMIDDCNRAYAVYTELSADYTYNELIEKHGEDLAFLLDDGITDNQKMKSVIEQKISECKYLGIPDEDISKVAVSGIEKFIIIRGEAIPFDVLPKSLQIKPSCFESLTERAMEKHLLIRAKEIDTENFIAEQNRYLALKEFLLWYKSNKQAYPKDIEIVIKTLIQKYNIRGVSYLGLVSEKKSVLKNYDNPNPYVLCELERKSFDGTLKTTDIETALMNGYIAVSDGVRLIENSERDVKPEVISFEMSVQNRISDENSDEKLRMELNLMVINLAKEKLKLSDAENQLSKLIGK